MSDALKHFMDQMNRLRPDFNRVAVHDTSILNPLERKLDPTPMETIAGIPVVVDASLPPGVIELRDGDTVVRRITGA